MSEEVFQCIPSPAACVKCEITDFESSTDSQQQVMVENDSIAANVDYILSEQCMSSEEVANCSSNSSSENESEWQKNSSVHVVAEKKRRK